MLEPRFDCALEFFRTAGPNALDAVSVGQFEKIWVVAAQKHFRVIIGVKHFLPLAHHAQKAVVDDRNFDRNFVTG